MENQTSNIIMKALNKNEKELLSLNKDGKTPIEIIDILIELKKAVDEIYVDNKMKDVEKYNLCEQILLYLKERIDIYREFFNKSYVLRWNSSQEEIVKFANAYEKLLGNENQENISIATDKIKNHDMLDVKIEIDKFIRKQADSLKIINEDIQLTDKEIHNAKLTIYHNEIRDTLSALIQIYNRSLYYMQEREICLNTQMINNVYDDRDEEVAFLNKGEKLKLLQDILDKIQINGYRKIEIYLGEEDKDVVGINTHEMNCLLINGYLLSEEKIYKNLKWNYEVFDEETGGNFAAQLQMSHIIFLDKVSECQKNRLVDLKSRCNIKYYFFNKANE